MRPLFLLRLVLDFVAAGLLMAALAYYWLDNATHEIIGTAMFLLLIAHNIFNRRWYGAITKGRREARGIATKMVNLALLATMIALLVTSVIISQTVFSFLPLTSSFTARQIHTLAAYLALVTAAIHLGLHWSMIMGVVHSRLGVTAESKIRTFVLRGLATLIAAYGVHSLFAVNVGSKLFMQMTIEFWDFQTSTAAFFVHHVAIIGLCMFVAHYGLRLLQKPRQRSDHVGSADR
ncbi:DUF4405 domain-containing protein [Mesorhizobium sp. AR10]|uniref:DUF4405 domain-containing protein n=1 Tax=Mesorhizobium sp. AR10 TaxID=2865839 RepID=UPI00215F92F6|nr:DUF4405 domain-containing protein [Mesorhizobium sp. AR10]UVK41704.1 DUF4405 domain-containing protein [Mesorhizobium sp. AR10]